MSNRIMSHMVACFPSKRESIDVAGALIDGGSSYLEVQFPFSDPSSDGYYIQEACRIALNEGFTAAAGFELIGKIRRASDIPVFVMCYANTVFFHGIKTFLRSCASSGAQGVIVPDLPIDYDEGLYTECGLLGLDAVPVVAPSISEKRLGMIMKNQSEHLYAALRTGITGSFTDLGREKVLFLKRVRSKGRKVFAGFGISERSQVDEIYPYVHAAVVGTAFVREIMEQESGSVYGRVRKKTESLVL